MENKILKDLEKVHASLPNSWNLETEEVRTLVNRFKRELEIMGEELVAEE